MPELPEVETVVRELKTLEGETIKSIKALWDRTIDGSTHHFKKSVTHKTISKVWRRGKYILFDIEDDLTLSIHLRMTGKCLFEMSEKDQAYERVRMTFKSGIILHYVDVRKFGRWKTWPINALLPKLGAEATSSKAVKQSLSKVTSKREIKKVLLDQTVLAGIGNIYADEALFLAKIHPSLPACDLTTSHISALSKTIPKVLNDSIANMGTTLSDYRNTRNIGGENQNYLKVYGQPGQACFTCESRIEKIMIGGRGTHFCPQCQPTPTDTSSER